MSDDFTSIEREYNTSFVDVYFEKKEYSFDRRKVIFDLRRNPELWKVVNSLIIQPKSEILHIKYNLLKSPEYFFKYIIYNEPPYPSFITKLTHEIAEAIVSVNGIYWEHFEGALMELPVEPAIIQKLKEISKNL